MRRAFLVLFAALVSTAGFSALTAVDVVAEETGKCTTDTSHDDMSDMDMDHGSAKTNCPVVRGARVVRVTGDRFRFTPTKINVTAGENVTIKLSSGDIAHDLYVQRIGHIVHAKAGESARGGLRIDKPGTYKFWCTIATHKQAGMTGKIIVS